MGLSMLEYIWRKITATRASTSGYGLAKVGTNIAVDDGVISVGNTSNIAMGSDKNISWSGGVTIKSDEISWNDGTKITSGSVTKAVWNDYADTIDVPDTLRVIPGKCYCYSNNEYRESETYLDSLCLGICTDTAGFFTGGSPDKNHLPIAISGFALAYVDVEYPAGTPLVCSADGYLTQINDLDLSLHSHEVVAHYWKPEHGSEWGDSNRKVQVNGRHWVKIR